MKNSMRFSERWSTMLAFSSRNVYVYVYGSFVYILRFLDIEKVFFLGPLTHTTARFTSRFHQQNTDGLFFSFCDSYFESSHEEFCLFRKFDFSKIWLFFLNATSSIQVIFVCRQQLSHLFLFFALRGGVVQVRNRYWV